MSCDAARRVAGSIANHRIDRCCDVLRCHAMPVRSRDWLCSLGPLVEPNTAVNDAKKVSVVQSMQQPCGVLTLNVGSALLALLGGGRHQPGNQIDRGRFG